MVANKKLCIFLFDVQDYSDPASREARPILAPSRLPSRIGIHLYNAISNAVYNDSGLQRRPRLLLLYLHPAMEREEGVAIVARDVLVPQ